MHPLMMAARLMVRDMGGNDQAARHLGKSGSSLGHELDPNCHHAKLGLLDAVTLVQASGDTRLVAAIASECGGTFLQLPTSGPQADDTMQHVTRLVGEFGDVLREVAASTADGRVSDNELASVQVQTLEVIGALQSLMVHLAQLNQQSKPPAIRAVA